LMSAWCRWSTPTATTALAQRRCIRRCVRERGRDCTNEARSRRRHCGGGGGCVCRGQLTRSELAAARLPCLPRLTGAARCACAAHRAALTCAAAAAATAMRGRRGCGRIPWRLADCRCCTAIQRALRRQRESGQRDASARGRAARHSRRHTIITGDDSVQQHAARLMTAYTHAARHAMPRASAGRL
jgi:hypothetical protein